MASLFGRFQKRKINRAMEGKTHEAKLEISHIAASQ